jgi:hypothetical protein
MKYNEKVATVLRNLALSVELNQVDALSIGKPLADMLDELASNDQFGTEGQLDPRGDGRNQRDGIQI